MYFIKKTRDVMFDTDQKHKQYNISLTTLFHIYRPISVIPHPKHHTYAHAPLPVIHKTEWVRLGSLVST